jgi:hypothetical protein
VQRRRGVHGVAERSEGCGGRGSNATPKRRNAEGPQRAALHHLVEAAGIEPASENATQSGLHA